MTSHEERALLESDFQVFLTGRGPPTVQLATAPTIEVWEFLVTTHESERCLTVAGKVLGHHTVSDNQAFETHAVVWIDRNLKWVRTLDGVFRLGDRATPIDGVDL